MIAEPITYKGQDYTLFSIELDGDITNLTINYENPLDFKQIIYKKAINTLNTGKKYSIVAYISSNDVASYKSLLDSTILNNYIKKCKSAFVLSINLSKSNLN